jgi:putative oxidoreductase
MQEHSMSIAAAASPTVVPRSRGLHIALWAAQVLLALAFAMAGGMKVFTPIADLVAKMPWVEQAQWLPRFIGVSELLGAVGLIVPAATRIKPGLTALAGAALLLVMILASLFHVSRGELSALPATVLLGALAAFVAWGRFKKAPIAPR